MVIEALANYSFVRGTADNFMVQLKVKKTYSPLPIHPPLDEIFRQHGLSERETEVANLMVIEGLDNEEISQRIFRTIITVKKCASQIYSKFGVRTRVELIALIVRKLCTLRKPEGTIEHHHH